MGTYDKLFEKFNLNKDEEELLNASKTATIADANQIKTISEIYLSKTIEQSVHRMIASNETLEKSNEQYNNKIVGLTKALVFVGVMQVIATIAQVIVAILG
ncbi:MAG: hypothetical protein K0R80_2150 [Clostridia bacterium]|nr:hypothetical protein [Clostridia bacterium]